MESPTFDSSLNLFLVLPGDYYPFEHLKNWTNSVFFLSEYSPGTASNHQHKLKSILMIAAMREYSDLLKRKGLKVVHHAIDNNDCSDFKKQLLLICEDLSITSLTHFENHNKNLTRLINSCAKDLGLDINELISPMFLSDRDQFSKYLKLHRKPKLSSFYQMNRKNMGILLDTEGKPMGGKWSLDADNRKKLPTAIDPPMVRYPKITKNTKDAIRVVENYYPDAVGDAEEFIYPVNHEQAMQWLDMFVIERLQNFGDYEDAMTTRSVFIYHSVLSPLLNTGLLTPHDVVKRILNHGLNQGIALNNIEGIIRQIIGWREFIRGIYLNFDKQQKSTNFFNHESELTEDWYTGTTGIDPLDDIIKKTIRLGWAHHIERLMVISNIMNLSRIKPVSVYKWFMEMFVDSSEWVMGPNVFGMGLFSDGGIFATKPYICGSSYILKMSDYRKGPWCDIVDGLYWKFVSDNMDYFSKNPRTAMMPKNLARLSAERKTLIFTAANEFLSKKTIQI